MNANCDLWNRVLSVVLRGAGIAGGGACGAAEIPCPPGEKDAAKSATNNEAEELAPARELEGDGLADEELARRVHKDPDWFLPLYRRYYDRILNYSYRRTQDRETAQDLTSQTFLAAFEYLRRKPYRASARGYQTSAAPVSDSNSRNGFRAWLYRIATNAQTTHWRKSARWLRNLPGIRGHFGDRVHEPFAQRSEEDERAFRVRKALGSLPEKYRVVVQLRYDEELTFEEIGAILGLAQGSVRSRISRALELMRKRLTKSARRDGVGEKREEEEEKRRE